MKAKKLLSTGLICMAVLNGGVVSAFAEETGDGVVNKSKGSTDIIVNITDDTSDTDPLPPGEDKETDDNDHLVLDQVPETYSFESVVTNKNYALNATKIGTIDENGNVVEDTNQIKVFNDRQVREWSLKAWVDKSQLERNEGETFEVSSFVITVDNSDGNDLITETGREVIIESQTEGKNTGTMSFDVEKVSIEFADSKGLLKAGDELTGTIQYQLYHTAKVE